MQLLAATVLLGVAQASLYPGQSNLNHTCQLRSSPPYSPIFQSNKPRNAVSQLLCEGKPKHHRQLLHRNLRRPRPLHPILVHLHRSRIRRPSAPRAHLDPPRSLAGFLQRFIHTILRSIPTIRSPSFPQHHNRNSQRNACQALQWEFYKYFPRAVWEV
jgi:hypothetical protein